MKALSLTQPWATLVAIGAKKIETRSFQRSYRGPLAIHAAQGLRLVGGKRGLHEIVRNRPFWDVLSVALDARDSLEIVERLPLGAIVAVVRLFDIERTEDISRIGWFRYQYPGTDDAIQWHMTEQEKVFGDYSPSRYAWLLANIRALPEPIHCPGALGLWELDAATLVAVERQL